MIAKTLSELNVCETCDIRHFDNCPTCFGFGVYLTNMVPEGTVPVSAGKAASGEHEGLTPMECPWCGSGPSGVPK